MEASGAEKSNCETALGRPEATKETRFSKPGGQKAPETEPGTVQNRIPEAIRAENVISSKTIVFSMKKTMNSEVPGSLFGAQSGSKMGSESHIRRGSLQKTSWRSLGALKKAWSAKGRLSAKIFWLMGRSWTPLGALLGPKKVVLNGSWPLQEQFQDRFQPKEIHLNPSWPVLKKFQDRFQPSWVPEGVPKAAQEGLKSSSRSDSSSKHDFFKKYRFFKGIPSFLRS